MLSCTPPIVVVYTCPLYIHAQKGVSELFSEKFSLEQADEIRTHTGIKYLFNSYLFKSSEIIRQT